MEPLVLRKRLFRLSLAVGLVAIALLAAWVAVRHAEAVRHMGGRPRGNEWLAGYDPPVKRYVPPTVEEMQAYQQISEEIVSAYSNGQLSAMRDWAGRFPEGAYHLRGGDSSDAIYPVERAWRSEHRLYKPLEEFATPEAFEHTMRMRMALAVIYGDFLVASGSSKYTLIELDFCTMLQLQEYEAKFGREGKTAFLSVAKRLESEWIQQVELENGFTRVCMRRQLAALRRGVEWGKLPEEALKSNGRGGVLPLQKRCGYTPKWLDEEFPVIEEKK